MSKIITFCIALLLCLFTANAQQTVTLGPGDAFNYNTLQEAHDALNAGDIIMVQQGGDYGSATFTKPLIVLGAGYLLNENNNSLSSNLGNSIGEVNLNDGAEGTYFSGIEAQNIFIRVSNVVIERCRTIGDIQILGSENVIISDNLIGDQLVFSLSISTNCTVSNNYIKQLYNGNNYGSYIRFENNIIQSFYAGILNYSVCVNNIFLSNPGNSLNAQNSFFNHNIFTSSEEDLPFLTGNNNITGVDVTTIFVAYPEQGEYSDDARWQLADGSPASGAGEGGTDCGIFGGDNPYVLSGLPAIPLIYELTVPQTAGQNSINVNVKARTNN